MQLRRRLAPAKSRWTTPITAVATSVALVAAAAFGGNQILSTQSAGSDPIDATTETTSFSSGDTVTVDDPAIASQGLGAGPRAVKEFHRDQPFSMFALTWEGDKDVAAFVRPQKADGTWGEWFSAEPMTMTSQGKNGTDLIFVGETNAVQVSVGNVDLGIPSDQEVAEAIGGEDAPADAPVPDPAPAPEAAPAQEAAPEAAPAPDTAPAPEAAPAPEVAPAPEAAPAPAAAPEAPAPAPAPADAPAPAAGPAPAAAPAGVGGAAPLPTNYGDIQPVADVIEQDPQTPPASGAVPASDLDAVFIDGKAEEGGIALAAQSTTYGMPNVVTRAGWRANEGIRCQAPTYDNGVRALTLHHTAGSNDYTPAESASIVRGIYTYHAQTLGWCDVGYNALVDKYGTIYEGRFGGLDKAVQGAHVGGFNSNTWGISMMGNYDVAQPTPALLNSVAEIAGWKAAISGFDPTGTVSLRSGGFNGSRYPAGSVATVPAFHGHSDLHFTACPGRYTIAQWPTIRQNTYNKYKSVLAGQAFTPSQTDPGSYNPSSSPDPVRPAPDPGANPQQPSKSSLSSAGSSALGSSELTPEQTSTIITIAAAVAGLAIASGAATAPDAQQEVAAGVSVGELPGIISQVVRFSGDPELQQTWSTVLNAFGPVLGLPQGGPNMVDPNTIFQLFDNGVVISNKDTGVHALIGMIAKAWASQDNAQRLGLPTSDQYEVDDNSGAGNGTGTGFKKTIRVDFQGGHITYDPNTQNVDVFTD